MTTSVSGSMSFGSKSVFLALQVGKSKSLGGGDPMAVLHGSVPSLADERL